MARRVTKEKFLDRARCAHGDQYDYSKVEYTNTQTKVEIVCRTHGSFWQTPSKHMGGQNCRRCATENTHDSQRLTKEQFAERSRAIHGDRYNYSRVAYQNNLTNVEILCPKHGSFFQLPAHHMKGHGCKYCGWEDTGKSRRSSTEEFAEKARSIHGDRYDYSRVIYKGSQINVEIVCPVHGSIWQQPSNHLMGGGCLKCAREAAGLARRKSTEEFIVAATARHGELGYDYSEFEYVTADTPGKIICPEHGEFYASPNNHLKPRGTRCPNCFGGVSKPIEEFLSRARQIHGADTYDYSKFIYTNSATPSEIICAKHGSFFASMANHVHGLNPTGCPACFKLKYNFKNASNHHYDDVPGYLYILTGKTPDGIDCFKVGVGTKGRINNLPLIMEAKGFRIENAERFDCCCLGEAVILEHLTHIQVYSSQILVPESERFGGYTELFGEKPSVEQAKQDPLYLNYMKSRRA